MIPSVSTCAPDELARLSTGEVRSAFLLGGLFRPGHATLRHWEVDGTVVGGVCPAAAPLGLAAAAGPAFLAGRELGVVNLGGPGRVNAGGATHELGRCDALYLGRGDAEPAFISLDPSQPATFYLLSYPADVSHPDRVARFADSPGVALGDPAQASARRLHKLIHPGAVPTCQLVLGVTFVAPGSVWNTFPPHVHARRSEVYLYFGLPADGAVFHFLGEPAATRHLVVREREAVLSPRWSVHFGAGTGGYAFIWGMGGENQDFDDVTPAPAATLH